MSIVLENLRRDTRMRIESDYEMSAAWMILPMIPILNLIVSAIVFFVTLFAILSLPPGGTPMFGPAFLAVSVVSTILGFGAFIAWILIAYMFYRLVNRRNKHFQRQGFLNDDLLNLARDVAAKKGVDISISLNNMQRLNSEARFEETEKSAGLWAIVTFFIGITGFYIAYFLMKDFYKHERREDMFIEDLNRAFMAAGITINLPRRTLPVPDRSFILYLILTILTIGVFGIYWLYTLLTDPTSHFRQQALTEDTILAQVTPVIV